MLNLSTKGPRFRSFLNTLSISKLSYLNNEEYKDTTLTLNLFCSKHIISYFNTYLVYFKTISLDKGSGLHNAVAIFNLLWIRVVFIITTQVPVA